MEEKGIKRTEDGGVFCEKCGNDLKSAGATKYVAHLDGAKCFTNVWECTKCSAVIQQTVARRKDAYWWAE